MDYPGKECDKKNKSVCGIYLLRQLFSCGSVTLGYFMFGLNIGAPTVIIPQMRREANSTDVATPEMISWLSCMSAYSAVPWAILWPMIAYRFGRKIPLIIIGIDVIVANVIFYYSKTIKYLIISQALLGMLVSSTLSITVMVMSEYTSPKYRGVFLTFKAASLYWGVWLSNAIGTFYHWRNIGIVIFFCSALNLLFSIFCYESPYWLATKGQFDECAKIHRWLKGTDETSEEELRKLILSQKEHLKIKAEFRKEKGYSVKLFNIIRYKSFYKPLLYASLPIFLFNLSGKMACSVYAIDIIKKITSSETKAYKGMLILDGVTVAGMYVGCVLCKYITRRVQLLVCSTVGVVFLYMLSIYLYMIKLYVISENSYVSLFLLMGYSLCFCCGPVILSVSISTELAPLRYRSYFVSGVGILANTLFATSIKIAPFLFQTCGSHGAFLFYAVCVSVATCLLYKYLPETKDKTIQEIQEQIAGVSNNLTVITELVPLKKGENTLQLIT